MIRKPLNPEAHELAFEAFILFAVAITACLLFGTIAAVLS